MTNKRFKSILTGAAMILAAQTTVFAMPGDIQQAVTQSDYNAYDHTSSYTSYSDSDLITINENYVATAQAMIRQSPFGDILGSVTPGKSYYVVGECPDCMWYKISGDITGYVYAGYMVPESSYTAPASTEKTLNVRSLDMLMTVDGAKVVNVRNAPTASGKVVSTVKEGDEVHVTGNVLNTEWYECTLNDEVVYICDDYLTPEFPQTMACTAKKLNVRATPDANGEIIGTLNHGDKEKITGEENDFLKFSLSDGTIGYVSDEYMAVVD